MNAVELVGVVLGEARPWISLLEAAGRMRALANPLEVVRFTRSERPLEDVTLVLEQFGTELAPLAGGILREAVSMRAMDVITAVPLRVAPSHLWGPAGAERGDLAAVEPAALRPFALALLRSGVQSLIAPDDLATSTWMQLQVDVATLDAWLPEFVVVEEHEVHELASLAVAGPSPAVLAAMRYSERGRQQLIEGMILGDEISALLKPQTELVSREGDGRSMPLKLVVANQLEAMWSALASWRSPKGRRSMRKFALAYFDDEVYPVLRDSGRYEGATPRDASKDRAGFYKRFAGAIQADSRDWNTRLDDLERSGPTAGPSLR